MDADRHRFLRLPHQAASTVRFRPRFYLCLSVSICGFTSSSGELRLRFVPRLSPTDYQKLKAARDHRS